MLRLMLPLAVLSLTCLSAGNAQTRTIDFNRDVRPILSENCFRCHGPDEKERKAKLRLDTRDAALGHGAIVAGQPRQSELIARIGADGDKRMPPPKAGKSLTPAQIATLTRWVAEGAVWSDHWAFVPPKAPPQPEVVFKRWPRNPIDRFILARLERDSLQPSPEADRATLIRRASFDLTGLPPTPAEVDAFLHDPAPDALEKLVDRLLASPRYGERMALDWLDAARYADTHGYHIDSGRDMTRWREWVIDAFNANMPFDRFTIEQLAGDLLPNATTSQRIASGFNRNHMINFEGGAIPEEYHTAYIVDRVNTTATVWLGLTFNCAQCHDHKYDPFSQRDYYRMFAFFHNVPEKGLDGNKGNAPPLVRAPSPEQEREQARLTERVRSLQAKLDGAIADVDAAQAQWEIGAGKSKLPADIAAALAIPAEKRSPTRLKAIRSYFRENVSDVAKALAATLTAAKRELADLEKQIPTAMVMLEMERPRDTYILMRGQYDKKGEKVTAGTPAALPPLPAGAPANRLGLARWLVAPNNPLTARVIVNRLWQSLFGIGLVKTSEDFGSQGEWPSHPELLDWLAVEFMRTGWDVKKMMRVMVTSATYRQSSNVTPDRLARDPENRLLARMSRLRLPAEAIRDQALAVSGLLNGEIGGKSVSPYQPPGLWEELMSREDSKNWTAQTYTQSHGKDLYRRTMYTFWKRTCPPPTLATFDAPDREVCTVRRARTNTPLQALILQNDPTYVEASRKLAERLLREADTTDARITLAYRLVLSRTPNAAETQILARLFDKQRAKYQADPVAATRLLTVGEMPRDQKLAPADVAAWTTVTGVILNLDEAITRN
jgi:hypothetical protein